ncbi:uncharacterized protein LOC34624195 [Cyclospora cayetanensis]|uniref:Uncharacterized protein LOC34624195 n=1 Tax=Cyclospora cayetanensis TaxID=88456 RepID=A0A6P6RT39_9EIME|nr:uncharacterized protein LOC34624195 [Cyclospora cayetanensis]
MCRLTAIITRGDPILLADILTRPRRSIIQQSFNCQERLPQSDIRSAYQKASLNGDGFGVGWYVTDRAERARSAENLCLLRSCGESRDSAIGATVPDRDTRAKDNGASLDDGGACVFTSLKPAWADRNLYNLAEKISSRLFFAHVRAASSTLGVSQCTTCTGGLPPWAVANGSVSTELCCHPFRCGRFLFMHNGSVGGFNQIRRDLLSLLPDPMFSFAITNSCIDSACLFAVFLALLPNMPTEPSSHSAMKEAVERMISAICWFLDKEKIEETTLINIVVSDGESIVATRFVTNAQEVAYESGKSSTVPSFTGETSPAMPASLYFATGTAWQQQEETLGEFRMTHRDKRTDICIVTSEPLTSNPEDWMPVPRNTMILITPSIDLLLYPIASVGYLPPLLRRRRRSISAVFPADSCGSFDKQLSLRSSLAASLASRLEGEFSSLQEMLLGTPSAVHAISEALPVKMLLSLKSVFRQIAAEGQSYEGGAGEEGGVKAWNALEMRLNAFEQQLRAAQAQGRGGSETEGSPHLRSVPASPPGMPSLPATSLQQAAAFSSDSVGSSQQCYELIAGTCAILCLESIMVHVAKRGGGQREASLWGEQSPPSLPVAAKSFVFAGMQSGDVVVYDAISSSVAPISFHAHVGGVLAMAVHVYTWTAGSVRSARTVPCASCGAALPEVFLVTGGSDTSLAVWDLSPLLFGGHEPRLLSGTQVLLDGPRVSIAPEDLLAVRLTFLPHQGDVLSLLVKRVSEGAARETSCSMHDPFTRVCTISACDACVPGVRAAMRLEGGASGANEDLSPSPISTFWMPSLHKVQPNPFLEDSGKKVLLFIGFQSTKIGAMRLSDLLRYFRHTQVMVSVLANAVSFQPTQQQALPLRVSRDFELKTLASGQLRVMFSGEQERESLRSLFTREPTHLAGLSRSVPPSPPSDSTCAVSPLGAAGLAADASFRSLLSTFARNLRNVTLHASHSATTFWPAKSGHSSGRLRCLYPPTGTIYYFEAPHELEVPLPEGAAASASPGTYRVVSSTSSLKIVAQPSQENGERLKIEMRFLPLEQSGVKRQTSHQSLVGPWLDESGHNGFVECLTSCGKVICSGGGDGRLLLWSESGRLVGELSGHHGGVLCVAYTEASVDALCKDLSGGEPRERLQDGPPSQADAPQSTDEESQCLQGLLFSGSRDTSIRVWALEQLVCMQTLNAHTSEVLALAADASRNILISGSANGELFVWQLDLLVVAFRLSLNVSPSFDADRGYFSTPSEARNALIHGGSSGSQQAGVSFTDLLLVSDASMLDVEDDHETPAISPRASKPQRSTIRGGLQLWAGRGDGKLGVWTLNETDVLEDASVGELEEPFFHPKGTAGFAKGGLSEGLLSECEGAPATDASERLLRADRRKGQPSEGAGTLAQIASSKDAVAQIQRSLSSRIGNMVITSGASMPSLPLLKSATGLEPRRSDFLSLLGHLVACKSVSASKNPLHFSGCIAAAKFVAQLFEQALGATVEIVWPRQSGVTSEFHGDEGANRPHPVVFGRLGTNPQHPTIVFYSHYDVVSPGESPAFGASTAAECPDTPSSSPLASSGSPSPNRPATDFWRAATAPYLGPRSSCEASGTTEQLRHPAHRSNKPLSEWSGTGWLTNPWKIHCKDGYIYGRGVTDNKGPIICSLLAVKHFISEWRRKHKARHAAHQQPQPRDTGDAASGQDPLTARSAPAVPFNFVWICEGDEENGSIGLADAVAQKASWLHGARFLICNNSYWADDTTPCLVYGMRGVLDIRVEATSGSDFSGYHSGVHGGVVEEPMQSLVHLLGCIADPATGRVTVPRFYDSVLPPDPTEVSSQAAIRRSWLEPSLSLLGINTSLKGKCAHVGGAMRVIPSTACAEISLRLVPQQSPKEVFALVRNYLEESFAKISCTSKLTVQCLRQGRSWRADLEAPRTRALYGAAHAAIKEVWGVDPLYVREGGSMPAIPFLADSLRKLTGPHGSHGGLEEVAICQLPFGQASDNAHLPNERLGIRQVEKGVDVLACTLEYLAARLAGEGSLASPSPRMY